MSRHTKKRTVTAIPGNTIIMIDYRNSYDTAKKNSHNTYRTVTSINSMSTVHN